jgi:hypothetical protein
MSHAPTECCSPAATPSSITSPPCRGSMPLATKRNVDVIVGGPYSLGALVGGATSNTARSRRRSANGSRGSRLCERHGVPTKPAALHFSLAHPAVAAVVAGSSRAGRIAGDVAPWTSQFPQRSGGTSGTAARWRRRHRCPSTCERRTEPALRSGPLEVGEANRARKLLLDNASVWRKA